MVKRMLLMRPFFSMAAPEHFLVLRPEMPVVVPVVMVMVALLLLTNLPVSMLNEKRFFQRTPALVQAVFCTVLIVAMITFQPDNSAPFIYFQF